MSTEHGWLPTPAGMLACHVTPVPDGVPARAVALLLPPVGYPYWSAYATVRALAEALARSGVVAVRVDHPGTGNSEGEAWAARLQDWQDAAHAAADLLRRSHPLPLVLVGLQLGGSLAVGARRPEDLLVLWEPVLSGRTFVRSLRLMGQVAPEEGAFAGGLTVGGFPFSADLQASLRSMATEVDAPGEVAVVASADAQVAARRVGAGDAAVDVLVLEGPSPLESPAEEAVVPRATVHAVVDWVTGRTPPAPPHAEGGAPLPLASAWSDGDGTTHQHVVLTSHELVGLLSTPRGVSPEQLGTVVVFLNSGSEMNAGPGRAWVEYAASLHAEGISTLRLDWSGWGESPDGGHAPGRPYDAHGVAETLEVLAELRSRGARVVLTGLCAGAWIALEVARRAPERDGTSSDGSGLAGVVALNPQLYWRPGDPVEALISTTIERRAPQREREQRWERRRAWSVLDAVGVLNREGRWLRDLGRGRVPVLLLYAEGDEGLVHLRTRLGRRLRRTVSGGRVRVVEVPDIDHSMHRSWLRDRFHAEIVGFVSQRVGP